MAAINSSEQTVVAKIDTLDLKVESKCQTLNDSIDRLRNHFKEQLEGVRTEFGAKFDPLAASFSDHETRLTSLEEATNTYSDRVVDLEEEVRSLKARVAALTEKTEDLEGRQRRCNIRILGVREKFETGTRPVVSVAKLLQEVLSLDAAPTLDRAHRGMQSGAGGGQRPRPFIVKFHYFQEMLEVLRKAARAGPLFYDGDKVLIFPDLPSSVAKRRGTFKDVKELLRGCQGVRYGMLYPARLRISSPLGEKVFTDPGTAKDYIMKHLVQSDQQDAG
ncbi:hypothetical protein NL108_018645 [Boleophthalmus pectinirostris]|nr:hypothetical protein NL108_018698 [Boleophthalmus pectinirostris]KAJ0064099.1 hypothetical protein NL108_018645 [Boleophthalmus pectinirostris]